MARSGYSVLGLAAVSRLVMKIIRKPADLPPEWRELYEERAAIREFCGNQSRPDAEREAWREVVERMRQQEG